ncbi:MAG: hypothetical protein JSR18_09685 [Proteobacteria bacterium]|nr:hypothetical protein [Pseudomonadota bacterium]
MAAREEPAFAALSRDVEVDTCANCGLLWLDRGEGASLTPAAVLSLFRVIADAGAPHRALGTGLPCPRCRRSLDFTHDQMRNTRFTYWRCPASDGQLITFGQFLTARQLVRPPTPAELARLRDTVRSLTCSQCGGPIDITRDSACPHCGAGIMLVDPDSLRKALRELAAAASAPIPAAAGPAATAAGGLTDAQIDALFEQERSRDRDVGADLLDLGATLARWFVRAA